MLIRATFEPRVEVLPSNMDLIPPFPHHIEDASWAQLFKTNDVAS